MPVTAGCAPPASLGICSGAHHLRVPKVSASKSWVTSMKRAMLWLIAAAVLLVAFLVYRSRSGSDFQVTPDAAREIERAKRR